MADWIKRARQARSMAYVVATASTLAFTVPVGGYLAYLEHQRHQELGAQATLEAIKQARGIERNLERIAIAPRLLAATLSSRNKDDVRTVALDLMKLNNALSAMEIAKTGQAPLTISLQDTSTAAPASAGVLEENLHVYPIGSPIANTRGNFLVISQALSREPGTSTSRFWGYTTAVVPLDKLVDEAELKDLAAEGYGVRLDYFRDGSAPAISIIDSAPGTAAESKVSNIPMSGGGYLSLAIHSMPGPFFGQSALTWFFLLFGSALLFALSLRLLRRPAELAREVARRTRLLDDEKRSLQLEISARITAERRLERSHQLLDSIFEHIPGMILLKRAEDLRIARINRTGEEILGRSRDSLLGRSNEEIYGADQADRISRSDYEAMLEPGLRELDPEPIRTPNQTERWLRLRKIALRDDQGKPEYILEFGEDITERERLDMRLREHLNFLEQLIDAIPGPMFFKDESGRYIGVNAAFEKFFGMSRAHLVGKTVFDVAPRQQAEEYHRADADLLENGGARIYESQLSCADGRLRDVMFHKAVFHATSGEVGGIVGIILDISERKEAEGQLHLAARVFENSAEGIVITDADNRILMVNKAFSTVTGYAAEEVIGRNPSLLGSGRQPASFYTNLWHTLHSRGEWRGELENRRKNGEHYPEWLNISVVLNDSKEITNYVAVFSDLTVRREIEERLNFLAHYDALTSLPNRILFTDYLEQAMARARSSGKLLAVMFLDVDRFKLINDTAGHATGDLLLLEIASRMVACVGQGNCVSRLGGDEFAIIFSNLETPNEAANQATALQEALHQPLTLNGQEIHVSASIGISIFPDDTDDIEALASNADSAMYSAIEEGGNTFRFFQQDMNLRSAERMKLEGKLHHALERGELMVYFQPLVAAASGRIVGAEALLRWQHADFGGFVSPATFVPLLEETGLIVPVGDWVLRTACEENRRWREATGEDIFVAVNLSAIQLTDQNLLGKVSQLLKDLDFDPRHLEIELTESAVMRDAERGIRLLNELKELGVSLSIDDFGTGYSSLSYLKRLPVDVLKIDRSFVMDTPSDQEAVSITEAIVALGHSLHLHIIAEGVQTPAQVDFLRDSGVDILQGFYFSQAIPAEEFLQLVSSAGRYPLPATGQCILTQATATVDKQTHQAASGACLA